MKGNHIAGEWVGAASGAWCERRNPADTREVTSRYAPHPGEPAVLRG